VNPRSPFVLDTRELGRRPGSYRDYRRDVQAPEHLSLEMIGVPVGSEMALAVRLESVTEGVLATGSIGGTLQGECGRCLENFTDTFAEDFMELFAYPNSVTEQTSDRDEISSLVGDHLDLEPLIRDVIVLGLPLTPLCRPDCAGLCSECGLRLDDLPPGHSHVTIDPRWAALAARTTESQE
jgi:uncharacterized protein